MKESTRWETGGNMDRGKEGERERERERDQGEVRHRQADRQEVPF